MKKSLLILGLALALFSCNKGEDTTASGFKTAYVDTARLSKEYEEFKDLDSKSKVKIEEMGREFDGKVQQWKMDYAAAENEAKTKGPQWAQLKAQELQKRERDLSIEQDAIRRQIQEEFGAKNDSAVNKMKRFIKDYGKKNGYDYIYGSGEIASIFYAKDGYDITDTILKELNAVYKGSDNKEDAAKKEEAAK